MYPTVLVHVTPTSDDVQNIIERGFDMVSDNPIGADDQQERPDIAQWVVGFVDGEGCFSIAVVRNASCRLGWQVQHEFSVVQAAPSRAALELLREFFTVGSIIENQRRDNHKNTLLRFSVKRRSDLLGVVIPFFEENPLVTTKAGDFARFRSVLHWMESGRHLTVDGVRDIALVTESMNRRQRSRYLESSEAIRQPALVDGESKIWS